MVDRKHKRADFLTRLSAHLVHGATRERARARSCTDLRRVLPCPASTGSPCSSSRAAAADGNCRCEVPGVCFDVSGGVLDMDEPNNNERKTLPPGRSDAR